MDDRKKKKRWMKRVNVTVPLDARGKVIDKEIQVFNSGIIEQKTRLFDDHGYEIDRNKPLQRCHHCSALLSDQSMLTLHSALHCLECIETEHLEGKLDKDGFIVLLFFNVNLTDFSLISKYAGILKNDVKTKVDEAVGLGFLEEKKYLRDLIKTYTVTSKGQEAIAIYSKVFHSDRDVQKIRWNLLKIMRGKM